LAFPIVKAMPNL